MYGQVKNSVFQLLNDHSTNQQPPQDSNVSPTHTHEPMIISTTDPTPDPAVSPSDPNDCIREFPYVFGMQEVSSTNYPNLQVLFTLTHIMSWLLQKPGYPNIYIIMTFYLQIILYSAMIAQVEVGE